MISIMRKLIVFMLSFIMVVLPMTAMAEVGGTTNPVFSDMPGDWSTEALQNAIKNGLLTGFDGKIMPKDNLTRAQMAAIINRAFGATGKASLEMFADVKAGDWFYDDMAKAVSMGTFKGEGNKLNPNAPITREEAFVVLVRALKLSSSDVIPTGFVDSSYISTWAKNEVFSLINAGYVAGSNGYINPKNNITRAEFAKIMDNIIKVYVKEAGEHTTLSTGNVIVNVPGVTLKDLTISGDLIVADGVGDGDLILDNVNVSGRMVVRGGGINSIIIRGDSKVGRLIISRVDGAIRVVTEDGAIVDVVNVDDGLDQVIIEGTVGDVEIETEVPVIFINAKVESVVVSASNAQLTVDENSKVEQIIVEASNITIDGEGKVKEILAKSTSSDSSFTTPDTLITTEEGASGISGTGGVEIPEGTTAKNDKDPDEPADIKKPVSTPSKGGSDKEKELELKSASMGDAQVDVTGNIIDVYFDLNKSPGTIEAVFNKRVSIVEISTDKNVDIEFKDVEDTVEEDLPDKGYTLEMPIATIITQSHLDFFGDTVYVTVRDNDGQELEFTINLIPNQD
ncbi:S-layer homology domain-containing protein [Tissierella creatinini]|nr:S-layer homology domain-containing protein [Tissierella creatinini]TJX60539.1 S-layer homology domain-containing protein [Soehngenia saccharolytica]